MIFKRLVWLFFFFLFSFSTLYSQSIQDIKKKKEKAEKEISYLNRLLSGAAKNRSVSMGKLNILQEKIAQNKHLLNSLNEEVTFLQHVIEKNETRIIQFELEKENTLELYSKLVYNGWKRRNRMDKLMFIFSSKDFNQAYNRFKYFQQIQSYSRRQIDYIKRINDSLNLKNQQLQMLVDEKNTILNAIQVQKRELESAKSKESQYISSLRKKEKEWKKKLQNEEQKRKRLDRELNKLISRQIQKSGSSSSTSYKLTPEEKLLSDDFVKNKGKLPWPVLQGFISKKFGLNTDPIYKKVKMFYDGIDIMTSKNANVRAIFKGVVTDIGYDPFMNNLIIIRHGSYLTVYANVIDVLVKKGDKVNTKDVIGKVGYNSDEGSVLIFQLWKDIEKQNPEHWLAK